MSLEIPIDIHEADRKAEPICSSLYFIKKAEVAKVTGDQLKFLRNISPTLCCMCAVSLKGGIHTNDLALQTFRALYLFQFSRYGEILESILSR